MTNHLKTIGGVFALENGAYDVPDRQLRLLDGDCHFLVNARGGIRLLLENLKPESIWLPDYLCKVMFDAAEGLPTTIRLYAIDEQLEASPNSRVLAAVRPGDLFIVVDYFGYVRSAELAHEARERGAIVVEDAAHALLSPAAGLLGDYVLWSPRKFAGIPDGGIIQARNGVLPRVLLPDPDPSWLQTARAACELRATFDAGGPREFLAVHQRAEHGSPGAPTAMSDFSRASIAKLDWKTIAQRRISNHDVLHGRLRDFALMPDRDAETVPFTYAIRLRNRDEVRASLFAQEVFPSILWPDPPGNSGIGSSAHQIAAEILNLPCDQRYDSADMDRIADLVLEKADS